MEVYNLFISKEWSPLGGRDGLMIYDCRMDDVFLRRKGRFKLGLYGESGMYYLEGKLGSKMWLLLFLLLSSSSPDLISSE